MEIAQLTAPKDKCDSGMYALFVDFRLLSYTEQVMDKNMNTNYMIAMPLI